MDSDILGPPVGYVDLLNEATREFIKKEASRLYCPIRPSAAGQCTRELYFGLMEYHGRATYPKPLREPNAHRLLSLGHSVEWNLIKQFDLIKDLFSIKYKQQVLSFAKFDAKNDPKLSMRLEGSLDLVLWSEKYRCVADVKSKGDRYDFQAKMSKWDSMAKKLKEMDSVQHLGDKSDAYWVPELAPFLAELNDPFFEANFLQLNVYANAEFLKERGVDHGAIFQYRKDDSALREIRFRPCAATYQKTLDKFATAIRAVDENNDKLATRDYAEGSFKCRYCPFEEACWGKKTRSKWSKK